MEEVSARRYFQDVLPVLETFHAYDALLEIKLVLLTRIECLFGQALQDLFRLLLLQSVLALLVLSIRIVVWPATDRYGLET